MWETTILPVNPEIISGQSDASITAQNIYLSKYICDQINNTNCSLINDVFTSRGRSRAPETDRAIGTVTQPSLRRRDQSPRTSALQCSVALVGDIHPSGEPADSL